MPSFRNLERRLQPTSPESADANSDEKKIKPASWREFWMFYKHPAIWGSHLFGALIALFAPDDILTQIPALKSFTTFMDGLFPVVGNYADKSQFPQISELYFATMIALGPLWFWRSWVTPEATVGRDDGPATKASKSWRWLIGGVLLWLFMIIVILFMFLFNDGYQYGVMPINSLKSALALFGPLFASGYFFLFAGSIHFLSSLDKAFRILSNKDFR